MTKQTKLGGRKCGGFLMVIATFPGLLFVVILLATTFPPDVVASAFPFRMPFQKGPTSSKTGVRHLCLCPGCGKLGDERAMVRVGPMEWLAHDAAYLSSLARAFSIFRTSEVHFGGSWAGYVAETGRCSLIVIPIEGLSSPLRGSPHSRMRMTQKRTASMGGCNGC
jgi:hypothetical protein